MNFKKNEISFPKKPVFTGYTWQDTKKSLPVVTLLVVVLCTFFVAFLLFKNFDRIGSLFSSSTTTTTFSIGQEVSLSGTLEASGDFVSYTHILVLNDTGIVGLKSRTLDLWLYSGFVDVHGVVEKEIDGFFILQIDAVSWALASTWVAGQLLWSGSGIYFPLAGVYLPAEFWQKYLVLNNWEDGVLKFQNITTNQVISLSYFACKKTDPNKNCSQLQANIWDTAEKTISTSRADKLYKLEWVTSWFVSNANYYGYFINDVPEQEVTDLFDALVLPNDYFIKNSLLSKVQTLCTDWTTSLMQVTTHQLGMDSNGLILTLQWPTADGSATCKVKVDPAQAAGGLKISYISNTPTAETPASSTPTKQTINTSVPQFPINLEKTMTFTSSTRGYSIIFPSSNLAYEALNVDEDLDLPGVRCSTLMNITKYADKATMRDTPKVKVFSCSIKGTLNNLWNSLLQKTSANGIQFLIQIVDPAWAEFAANITIN